MPRTSAHAPCPAIWRAISCLELLRVWIAQYKLKKVVGGPEEFTAKGLTIKAHAFTASARAAIEGNGGTCVVLPKTAPAEKAE